MNKGYDSQSAEAKAQKRLKTEKYLKRAALVGGVALGAYMGYKGTNYIINQKRAKDIARGLKKMNAIREENSMAKKANSTNLNQLVENSLIKQKMFIEKILRNLCQESMMPC